MNTPRTAATSTGPLDILGISEMEEQAYRSLLSLPNSTAGEIAKVLRVSLRKAQQLLEELEAKGLVTHLPERSRKYIPASPGIAMEAIVLQRQRDLEDARVRINELQREMAAGKQGEEEQMIEMLSSHAATRQTYLQLHRAAQHDVCVLVRPPVTISNLEASMDEDQQIQIAARARGARYRTIVDASVFALPGAVDRVRREIESGEEYRVFSHLPFKMLVVDRKTAMVPLNLSATDSPYLLVRSSALLDALDALFEILWDRSMPVSFSHHGMMETGTTNAQWTKEIEEVLTLLALGMNDKAITLELNISTRTLARRIGDLMQNLDARTRFQAGWLAARRFSIEPPT